MAPPSLPGVPEELWTRAASAPHRLLLLDYDGTLAPFRVAREEAFPLPGVTERLERIAGAARTTLALVSGRSVLELLRFLGGFRISIVGEHGWEARSPEGALTSYPLPPGCAHALDLAAEAIRARGWAGRLERKRSSLALHTRGLPETQAREMEEEAARVWRSLAPEGLLQLVPMSGGLELRAIGLNKGTAVRALLAPCVPGTLPVALGDDESDEDAFREVAPKGFAVRVGPRRPSSFASAYLNSHEEVPVFLDTWLRRVEGSSGGLEGKA